MDHDLAQVGNHPTGARVPFDCERLTVFLLAELAHGGCQRLQHAVAGSGANDEIISQGGYLLNIQKKDFFSFFIFQ